MSDQPVDIDLEELKELIRLLRESNVTEFELRKADYRLRIKQGVTADESSGSSKLALVPANGEAKAMEGESEALSTIPVVEKDSLHEVRSPIVGTFYHSSSPGASPFVEVGEMIRKNQVLCIVEAMKIMNEIESDVDGEIRAIHAVNGQPVEFGELLFSIKPTV